MDSQKIKVYSTPTCAYCFALKDFLKENDINFEEIDIAVDSDKREEMIKKSGQMQVPVVDINGEIVIGFDKEKIKNLLNLK
ncbi:MAG: glutaredoxin domain-containing protein [Candidatus Pacebacteria bacterium]|nr:glutaredoxin domain-containing protein [Candidatus Paceibacterota bacterium]